MGGYFISPGKRGRAPTMGVERKGGHAIRIELTAPGRSEGGGLVSGEGLWFPVQVMGSVVVPLSGTGRVVLGEKLKAVECRTVYITVGPSAKLKCKAC